MSTILDLPEQERPRERLYHQGAEAMTSAELIAIILGSGSKQRSVLTVAQELIAHFNNLKALVDASVEELCQVAGIGTAKAIQVKAALALGMRANSQKRGQREPIEHPSHAYELIKDRLEGETRELMGVILQDTKGRVIGEEIVSIGTLSKTLVHPREVFYPAIRHKAASFILFHNHPSGDPTPSKEDFIVTKELVTVSKTMRIPMNDHLILGDGCYTSLRSLTQNFNVF